MPNTFFCKGHLEDTLIMQASPIYPWCQSCYDFLVADGSMDYLVKTAKRYPENADWLARNNGKTSLKETSFTPIINTDLLNVLTKQTKL
jgi:uncharacterized protein Yka (UPF0111/DUF47 family)